MTASMEAFVQDAREEQKGWLQSLVDAGQAPEDSVELRRQKSLLVVVTLLKASICAGWYIPLAILGAYYAAAAPFVYQLATALSVLFFAHSKDLESFRSRQMLLILLLPMGVHVGLGGFAPSGGVLVWSFLAPLISILFEGPRASMRWFMAFVFAVLLAGCVEYGGLLAVHHLPWWMKLLFFVMNFICVTGIVYAGVRYFAHLLEKEKKIQVKLNEQLIQANEHKSSFLARMSHELRTPLNAIIGFTRIVKRRSKKELPQKQIDNLNKVLGSADHLLGLINDILDLAKIEAGHIEVHNESFSLKGCVETIIKSSEPLTKEGVKLVAVLQPDLPPLYSDEGKIKQIILNLVSNAAKFTHEGEIKVIVSHDAGILDIAVQDTGVGIPQDAKARIFEEFQQANVDTNREYGGTGLGLSISSRLAQLVGGSLHVESTEGEGSTFHLVLPLKQHHQEATPENVVQAETKAKCTRTILAIDDDPDVIYMLQESLQDTEYQVIGANCGESGIRKAREIRPYAITLDVQMPRKDGWQTLHGLKQNPQTSDIPVIMLSIIDNKELGRELGAADCLLKPLHPKAIKQALDQLPKHTHGKPEQSEEQAAP